MSTDLGGEPAPVPRVPVAEVSPVPPVTVAGVSPVPPGSGWPGDLASPGTPVARQARDVARLARSAATADELDARVSVCRACPRLVAWREQTAREKRASFAGQTYWGRPVTSWGPTDAPIAVIGLAPAAHGGNRTGRVFTGDRSGDWLFAALHRGGLASQPRSVTADDGQQLLGCRILVPVHCAPPDNRPTPAERDTCRPWLERDLELLGPGLRVAVALGGFAWQALWPALAAVGVAVPRPRPAFGHGVEVAVRWPDGSPLTVLGCYHVSQQNTFTGRLTEPMLDAVVARTRALAGLPAAGVHGPATAGSQGP